MKLISWNINGYRSITGQNPSKRFDVITKENKLFAFIESESPDIICLQETKADESQIAPELLCPEGYLAYYNSCSLRKGYSGVACFTKREPIDVITKIGIEKFDAEGRVLGLDFGDYIVFSVYFPKGEAESDRLTYKLEFYDEFFRWAETLAKSGKKLIIGGDYNTAHNPIDLARPRENVGTSGFMPIEREKLDYIASLGYIDTFRKLNSSGGIYSWWSNRGRARENNVGWRLDYFFTTSDCDSKIRDCYYLPDQLGSDHCPIVLELDA
jgi:exodeoxyribonuclease-3